MTSTVTSTASSARPCRSVRWNAWRASLSSSTASATGSWKQAMSPRVLVFLFLRRWHMRIGLAAVVFFLFLAVTGVVLNHGAELGLDNRYVHASWLARWYGISAERPRHAFRSGGHDLIAANGRWVLDGRLSGERFPPPIGLVELPDMVVVASSTSLYLYGRDG